MWLAISTTTVCRTWQFYTQSKVLAAETTIPNTWLSSFEWTDKLAPTTHTVVGGKGYRAAQLEGIGDNVIFLTTLGYGPHDAMCCPSIKGSARFVLADGKLVSQPPPPSPKLRQ